MYIPGVLPEASHTLNIELFVVLVVFVAFVVLLINGSTIPVSVMPVSGYTPFLLLP